MALDIDPASIAEALRRNVESFTPSVDREEVGRVIETGDGIARVSGLPGAMANELLEFPGGILGLAFNLDEFEIGCIILGESSHIEEGDTVKQTGQILSIPVGDAFLGRVVDALGRPIDGKGPIAATERRNLEVQAANVVSRQPVKEPLYTGITAIDAMTAIGRGQRQLIIGDRQTGKTAVAVDAIIAQRELWGTDQQVKCIYVAVGQKDSTVAEVVETLRENGALEYTVVVNAGASSPAPFQYLAPYAGAALGAYWMYNGEASLVVYDDLSKQATAYRTLSLLLRRPPGREAYPGDVFYLHSRLAGARRQTVRRAGWRLADRATHHRDQGRRCLRLHPHERDLDHRRPDLPGARTVLLGRAARHQRGHLGVPRGRCGPDQGDEEGGRPPAHRPRSVPRAGGLRAVRLGAGQGVAAAARARGPGRGGPEAAPVPAAPRGEAGRLRLRRHQRGIGRLSGPRRQTIRGRARRVPRHAQPRDLGHDPLVGRAVGRDHGRARRRHRDVRSHLRLLGGRARFGVGARDDHAPRRGEA